MRINLTQHKSSPAQGCAPRSEELRDEIKQLLTFEELPEVMEIIRRAHALADIADREGADEAMVGGAAYLVIFLDAALRMQGIEPVFAFSKRESREITGKNGVTIKIQKFKHLGFVRL